MSNEVVVGRVASRANLKQLLIVVFIYLFISGFAEAKTQGHPFSQIYYVDTNLNMSGFNITNISYVGIGTISPAYPLDVVGTGRITNNLYVGGNLGIGTATPTNELNVIGDINATGIIYGKLGSLDAVNSTNIADSSVTDSKISDMGWAKLQNYPSACASGEVVQGVGDVLTCVSVSNITANLSGNISGSGTPGYIPVWTDVDTLGNSFIYQSGGLLYTTSGIVLGGNINMQNSNSLINATFVNATNIYAGGNAVLTTATAFGGNVSGSWNALNLAAGSVDSAKILDNSIASGDIANGAIGAAQLATVITLGSGQIIAYGSGIINASQLNGQFSSYYLNTSTNFAGGNITGTYNNLQLSSGSVGAGQIINGVIDSSKLVSDLNLSWANLTNYPAACSAGKAIQSINDTAYTCIDVNSTSGNISGSGNQNYVAKFTASGILGNSIIFDNGSNVGIGTAQPNSTLHVAGNITVTPSSDVCIDGGNCLSSISTSSFYDKTAVLYTGNLSFGSLRGYTAGNAICNASFSGSHLCSVSEISYTISTRDLSGISGWTGEAWIVTGPAKYSPAPLPVTDCNGFTHGTAGSYFGNWWSFNQSTGGVGKTGHCGNNLSLGCCK